MMVNIGHSDVSSWWGLGATEADLAREYLQVRAQETNWRKQHWGFVVLLRRPTREVELAIMISNVVQTPEAESFGWG
jgi:hypothetical protein